MRKAGLDIIECSHDKEKAGEAPSSDAGLKIGIAATKSKRIEVPAMTKQPSAPRGRLGGKTVPRPTARSRTASPVNVENPTVGKTRAAQSAAKTSKASNGQVTTSKIGKAKTTKTAKAGVSSVVAPKAGTGKERAVNLHGRTSAGMQGGKRGVGKGR